MHSGIYLQHFQHLQQRIQLLPHARRATGMHNSLLLLQEGGVVSPTQLVMNNTQTRQSKSTKSPHQWKELPGWTLHVYAALTTTTLVSVLIVGHGPEWIQICGLTMLGHHRLSLEIIVEIIIIIIAAITTTPVLVVVTTKDVAAAQLD